MPKLDSNTRKTPILVKHHKAIVKLFARFLDVSYELALAGLQGVMGKKAWLYGQIEDLAKMFLPVEVSFSKTGAEILTGPLSAAIEVACQLQPDTPTCPNPDCEEFPIHEAEIEAGFQRKGTCPVCLDVKRGKLEAQETVETEHLDWTNGLWVPLTKTANTTSVANVVFMLTEDGILRQLEDRGVGLHSHLEQMIKATDKRPALKLGVLLFYVRTQLAKLNSRLEQHTACLRFLCDPYQFDIDNKTQLESIIDDAAQMRLPGKALPHDAFIAPIIPQPEVTSASYAHRLRDRAFVRKVEHMMAELYPTDLDARRMVSDAGLEARRIGFTGNAGSTWFNIITEAGHHNGKVAELIELARREGYGSRIAELLA